MNRQCSNRFLHYVLWLQPGLDGLVGVSRVPTQRLSLSRSVCALCVCGRTLTKFMTKFSSWFSGPEAAICVLGCPLNKDIEMHCNANDVYGLCHLPRQAMDVCEHTFIKWLHLFYHLPLREESLVKISERLYSTMTIISAENVSPECNSSYVL